MEAHVCSWETTTPNLFFKNSVSHWSGTHEVDQAGSQWVPEPPCLCISSAGVVKYTADMTFVFGTWGSNSNSPPCEVSPFLDWAISPIPICSYFFFPFIIHQLISWELWLLIARVVFLASTAGSKNWIKSSPAPTFIIERTLPHTPWKEGCSLCVRYNKTLQASWAVFGKSCHWFGYSGPWTLYNSLGRFPRSVLTSVKVALLLLSMLCEFCSCFFSCLVFQTITKQKVIFLITALLVSSFLWIYLLLPQCHLLPQHLSDLPNKF